MPAAAAKAVGVSAKTAQRAAEDLTLSNDKVEGADGKARPAIRHGVRVKCGG